MWDNYNPDISSSSKEKGGIYILFDLQVKRYKSNYYHIRNYR